MKYSLDLKSPGAQIKSEKLKASLARHQEEMERLIKNISLRIKSQKPTDGPPPTPFKYSDELEDLEEPFDFTLQKHKGIELKSIKIQKLFSCSLYCFLREVGGMPQR